MIGGQNHNYNDTVSKLTRRHARSCTAKISETRNSENEMKIYSNVKKLPLNFGRPTREQLQREEQLSTVTVGRDQTATVVARESSIEHCVPATTMAHSVALLKRDNMAKFPVSYVSSPCRYRPQTYYSYSFDTNIFFIHHYYYHSMVSLLDVHDTNLILYSMLSGYNFWVQFFKDVLPFIIFYYYTQLIWQISFMTTLFH